MCIKIYYKSQFEYPTDDFERGHMAIGTLPNRSNCRGVIRADEKRHIDSGGSCFD
jgi:hypothetical protein